MIPVQPTDWQAFLQCFSSCLSPLLTTRSDARGERSDAITSGSLPALQGSPLVVEGSLRSQACPDHNIVEVIPPTALLESDSARRTTLVEHEAAASQSSASSANSSTNKKNSPEKVENTAAERKQYSPTLRKRSITPLTRGPLKEEPKSGTPQQTCQEEASTNTAVVPPSTVKTRASLFERRTQPRAKTPPEVTPRDIITEKNIHQTEKENKSQQIEQAGCTNTPQKLPQKPQVDFAPGDIIRFLKDPEFFHHFGVITKVADNNLSCTAIVLEGNKRFGVEERWPYLTDISIDNDKLRLGTRILVNGLKSEHYQRYNGLAGRIIKHPREGHPAFVRKPKGPEKFLLTVLVQFDDPVIAGKPSVILEPRFLTAYDKENKCEQQVGAKAGALAEGA